MGKECWRAGIYARISVEHRDKKSESISRQFQIARAWIEKQVNMKEVACYTDIGQSGLYFQRPGFDAMMADCRSGIINCIVVKDLSRFGRNHLETGEYLERIFPVMQVRFVAVTDQYDSFGKEAACQGLAVNLKNLVNELYARDIGARVAASAALRKQQGSYVGSMPPYGYRILMRDKKRLLEQDPQTAWVVNDIFRLYQSGCSICGIQRRLCESRLSTPAQYKKTGRLYQITDSEITSRFHQLTDSKISDDEMTNHKLANCIINDRKIEDHEIADHKMEELKITNCEEGITLWGRSTLRFMLSNPLYAGGASVLCPLVDAKLFYSVQKRLESHKSS